MHIIFETRSSNGYISTKEVKCTHFYTKDNIRIKNGVEQDVIICKLLKGGTISIAFFGSTAKRALAMEALKKSSSSIVFLDYNKYFTYEAWDDEYALKTCNQFFGNFTLQKSISIQLEQKIKESPENTDAFKGLGVTFIDAMKQGKFFLIEDENKYSCLWAKCLWTPSLITSKGISPRQYFLYLIKKNNEKFNNSNHTS